MARVTVVYRRGTPSVAQAKEGRDVKQVQPGNGSRELVDPIAMKKKAAGTDGCLEQWAKGRPESREGGAREAAEAVATEIEARYEAIRAEAVAGS